jgi:hypothetical protein
MGWWSGFWIRDLYCSICWQKGTLQGMRDNNTHRNLWYTRRDSVVRGPWPEHQVSRYILLGRIRETDEVRSDGGVWQKLADCPFLIPDVMKMAEGDEKQQKLLLARLREDERLPGDRREREPRPAQDIIDRRSGVERRQPESEAVIRHRELRHPLTASTAPGRLQLYLYPLLASLLVLLGFGLSYLLKLTEPVAVPPDCAAQPRPGVNWEHCDQSGVNARQANLVGAHLGNSRLDTADFSGARLAGVDLKYASIDHSDLSHADLSHASLVGAMLRNANLRFALLTNADMSYADLGGAAIEGADFSGAVLDNAIWVDGLPCVPGSLGVCQRTRTVNVR